MTKDYSNGKIYKISCMTTKKIYIGSTTETLKERLRRHKGYFRDPNYGISSKEVLENNNYKIELIENFSCQTKQELLWRERYWIEKTECVNRFRPIVSTEESKRERQQRQQKQSYREYHRQYYLETRELSYYDVLNKLFEEPEDKEHKIQHKKEIKSKADKKYYEANKDKIMARQLEHFRANKEQIYEKKKKRREDNPEVDERHKEYHREWVKNKRDNDEEFKKIEAEKALERYNKKKEEINKKRAEKIPCPQCQKILSRASMSIHKKKYCQ